MSQTATTPAQIEATDVRFSIRSLLLVMVPVAVVAAAAGQCIRRLEPTQQAQAAAAWGAWMMVVIAWVARIASKRVRVEKLAGRTIMRLPIYGMNPIWRTITRYLWSADLISIGPLVLIMLAGRAAQAKSLASALLTVISPDAIGMAWLTAICVALWWWPRDIRLCEEGVLWDQRFIRWSDARERWDPDCDAVTIYGPDQHGSVLNCDIVVSDDQRNTVEALLDEKLPKPSTTASISTAGA